MSNKRLLLTILMSLALCLNVAGQSDQKNQNDELKAKALSLLVSLAGEVGTLQSSENRARIGSNLIDSLWVHDEQRARNLVLTVQNDIRTALQSPPGEDESDRWNYMVFMKLRLESVERIAKHDPVLALEFLNSTKPTWTEPLPFGDGADYVKQTEFRLARKLADKHPEATLRIGREILERGLSDDLVELLQVLGRKHRYETQVLYRESLAKLKSIDPTKAWSTTSFINTLAYSLNQSVLDSASIQEFIRTLKTLIASVDCTRTDPEEYAKANFCAVTQSVIQKLTQDLRSKTPTSQPEYYPRNIYELMNDQTVDEVLALIPEYPTMAQNIYWYAAIKAASEGDLERARQIASQQKSESGREQLLAQINGFDISEKIKAENLNRLYASLGKMKLPARVLGLVWAASAVGESDRPLALKLLKHADGIVDEIRPGRDKAKAQILLAASYSLERNERGFAIVESLVPKLNELVMSAMNLDGFEATYVREGEWNMTGAGSVGDLLTVFSTYAGNFAWYDFDKSVSFARNFDRPEIRIMAQLKLAQSILSGPPKRPRFGTHMREYFERQ